MIPVDLIELELDVLIKLPSMSKSLGAKMIKDADGKDVKAIKLAYYDPHHPMVDRVSYFDLTTGEYLTDCLE